MIDIKQLVQENDEKPLGAPVHPGEILADYLEAGRISGYRLAKATGLAQSRVDAILHGRRGISAETALRLGCYFRTSPRYWLNLQSAYELTTALTPELQAALQRIEPLPETEPEGGDPLAT
jgi:addiction module HigA family antidote